MMLTGLIYTRREAVTMAALLNLEDDDWSYEVEVLPGQEMARVAVYDADDEFIGYL